MNPVFGPMRPAFLILTPACVALGLAVTHRSGVQIDPMEAVLVLFGAVAAHISVNALNEFVDFRSGLDSHTRRTPFSGGSGTLPAHPELAPVALVTGLIGALAVLVIGLYFLAERGFALLPLGLLGLGLVLAYTPWLTRRPWLCLIAPGVGFGPCMVMGTEVALAGHYSWSGLFAALIPFFLVSNLLLLNQFPDVEADRSVGRSNLPILLGFQRSARVYILFFVLASVTLGGAVGLGYLPAFSLIGGAGLAAAAPVVRNLDRFDGVFESLLPSLGLNVVASVATPALVALGVFIGTV
ncbi:MAG: prenyltransferase [Methylotetracoccus sp.]|nr:prenyltransferase [Methylotetracoccus sp.]